MKKISVIYATKTKHSRKIAEAVAAALGAEAQDVSSKPAVIETDLLFVVGGIYGGESLPEMLEYVSGLTAQQIKGAALITSCASGKQGQKSVRSRLEANGIPVVDEFLCYGSFLFMRGGHPNKAELQSAADFAVRLAGQEGRQ